MCILNKTRISREEVPGRFILQVIISYVKNIFLPGAVEKKKYPDMLAAVDALASIYHDALDALATSYGLF